MMRLRAIAPIQRMFDEASAREFHVSFLGDTPWGSRDMPVKDPFANRLTLTDAIST